MNLDPIYTFAKPADPIFLHGTGILSDLIGYGQRHITTDGKPSRWSHIVMYVDSVTVAESTMDFNPYLPTDKRMDNGPQRNDLISIKGYEYGTLFCFDELISNKQRQKMLDIAKEIVESGEYRYDVLGLFGALLAYRLHLRSNPLGDTHRLFCSAFYDMLLDSIGFDTSPMTCRATSPEHLFQWCRKMGMREIKL